MKKVFSDDKFTDFCKLLMHDTAKRNKYRVAMITEEALAQAFQGVQLNEDQAALVEMVVNTINSKSVHKIEYCNTNSVLSDEANFLITQKLLYKKSEKDRQNIGVFLYTNNNKIPVWFLNSMCGSGVTVQTRNGTYSVIISDGKHEYARALTTGHELFGHGRSFALGRGRQNQHHDAIQTENLIRRVMGIPEMRTGEGHGDEDFGSGYFPDYFKMPSYR